MSGICHQHPHHPLYFASLLPVIISSYPIMWSSTRDRMENNMSLKMEDASSYIQQQISLNRSEILLKAVQQGLVSIEDICSYPIDWTEMASSYLTCQEISSIRSNTFEHQMTKNTSLGLYFDESCKSSLSSSSSSSRISMTPELMTPSFFSSSRNSSLSSNSTKSDEELNKMLSINIPEAMKDSVEMPMTQEFDEKMLYSNFSYSSNEDVTSSSTPATSMPPTPTFSIRELSSDPESFLNSPIFSETGTAKEDLFQTFANPTTSEQIHQPLAKRRKVMENFYLSNLSTITPITNSISSWTVPIHA